MGKGILATAIYYSLCKQLSVDVKGRFKDRIPTLPPECQDLRVLGPTMTSDLRQTPSIALLLWRVTLGCCCNKLSWGRFSTAHFELLLLEVSFFVGRVF